MLEIKFQKNKFIYKKKYNKIMGNGIIRQIDEFMLKYIQKYYTGIFQQENRQVFGVIEYNRTPSRFYTKKVQNRKQDTLLPIIKYICPEETII